MGYSGTKHGMSHTRIYRAWVNMRCKCRNPKQPGFKSYGARGIKVCERWQNDFAAFLEDVTAAIGEPPNWNHGLALVDDNDDFQPGNVKWASKGEIQRLRREERLRVAAKSEEKL